MQREHTSTTGGSASISRRNFLTIAATGAAATVPAVAMAEASGKTSRLPQPLQLSIDDQLDACVGQLKSILQQMYPLSRIHPHYFSRREDGSFRFSLQGDVAYSEYEGEGVYQISLEGFFQEVWLSQDWDRSHLTGEILQGCPPFYWAAWFDDDGHIDVTHFKRLYQPNIVRKLRDTVQP